MSVIVKLYITLQSLIFIQYQEAKPILSPTFKLVSNSAVLFCSVIIRT